MLTGNDLLTKVQELRSENPAINPTDLVIQCGYVKENGNPAYTDYYMAFLAAKDGDSIFDDEDDEDDENGDLYEDLCDNYPQEAVDAFIKLYDRDSLKDFEDAYVGYYDSEADFAEQYWEMCGESEIPSWLVIDWKATWDSALRFDFVEEDGHFFRNC